MGATPLARGHSQSQLEACRPHGPTQHRETRASKVTALQQPVNPSLKDRGSLLNPKWVLLTLHESLASSPFRNFPLLPSLLHLLLENTKSLIVK